MFVWSEVVKRAKQSVQVLFGDHPATDSTCFLSRRRWSKAACVSVEYERRKPACAGCTRAQPSPPRSSNRFRSKHSFDLGFIDDEDANSNGPSDDEYVFVEDDAAGSTDEHSSSEADEDENEELDFADGLLECRSPLGRRIGQGAERSR